MSSSAPALPELAADLWRFAQATAGGRGFQFSSECALQMQNLIRDGVIKLIQVDELQNAAKIAETKDAVTRLVAKMVELSIEQQRTQILTGTEATSTRMLYEVSFFSARSWFCPCFPFC
jgi:hypothetical protein